MRVSVIMEDVKIAETRVRGAGYSAGCMSWRAASVMLAVSEG